MKCFKVKPKIFNDQTGRRSLPEMTIHADTRLEAIVMAIERYACEQRDGLKKWALGKDERRVDDMGFYCVLKGQNDEFEQIEFSNVEEIRD